MKKLLTICYIILLLSYGLPPIYRLFSEREESYEEKLTVKTAHGDMTVSMEDYVFGVTAAEMPAYFETEALKAQTVAARSYTQYCINSGKHGGAVCTSSGCCQAFADSEQLRSRWGKDYDRYASKLRSAVRSTEGERLSYKGESVQAVFHSCSYRRTENSGDVWDSVPYLVSVYSPETPETVTDLVSTVRVSPEELKRLITQKHEDAVFEDSAAQWLGKTEKDAAGRTAAVTLGGVRITGREARSLFLLRSADFDTEYDGEDFVFTVYGFGHGVGMSQYGAQLMAKQGKSYREILAHYYPGTDIVS